MGNWNNIVLEAFCFGPFDGQYPCGKECPDDLCLHNGQCPYLEYYSVGERTLAADIPLKFIFKDRISIWLDSLWWEIRWLFWDRFRIKETNRLLNSIPSQEVPEWDACMAELAEDYKEWIKTADRGEYAI